ncbi:SdiA-regulated domain-containing protein [Azotobacter armeniacus]
MLALAGLIGARLHGYGLLHLHLLDHWSGKPADGESIWLPGYRVRIDAKPIAGIENLSGITYDHDRNRLLTVSNGGAAEILALDKTGEVLERYRLEGFVDIEGLAYLGNGRLVLAEEISQRLNFVDLPAPGGTIKAEHARTLTLEINLSRQNKGFEGIAYDAGHDRLFVVKERDPRQLYEIGGPAGSLDGKLQLRIRDLTSWIERSVSAGDLSDVHYDPRTGHLTLLSDESKLLVELDGEGNFVSFRSLRSLASDLEESAPQPEGVTMDAEGNLYVVSEPNLFYAFQNDGVSR